MNRKLLAATVFAAAFAAYAQAADLPRLHWLNFIVESDSSGKSKSWSFAEAPDGMSVSFLFDSLAVQLKKGENMSTAALSGAFDIAQPASISAGKITIDVRGHVTKTKATSASLEIALGPARKKFDWPAASEQGEDFLYSFEATVPDGRLHSPFPLSATATATREGAEGEVLVTLDSIDWSVSR